MSSLTKHRLCAWITSVVTVSGVTVFADGFRNPPPSASGLGAIGARYTLIKDASSMSYNPANLTELDDRSALLAATFVKSEKEYTSPAGARAHVNDDWIILPNLYFAAPYEENRLTAGIAVTTPFGQSTEYEKTTVFRYTAPYFAEMKAINVNPTVALKVNDRVSVAAGADIMWSELDLRQVIPWSVVTGNPVAPDGNARYEADGVGVGGNAGVLIKLAENQELGLTYRSAIDVDYEGDFKAGNFPAALPPPLAAFATSRSDFETEITFPHQFGVGYGIRVNERLALAADVEWFQWSDYDEINLDIDNNTSLQPAPVIPQDWDDTWTYAVGAIYNVNETWTARAGYIYLETPVPENTMLPALPENDQHVITVGIGRKKGSHHFDIAYGLGLYEDRDVANNQNPAYNGEYEFRSHLVGVSYGVAF